MLTGQHLDKFLSRIMRGSDDGGCWMWNGAHISSGYPETWDGTRPLLAHRAAHELWIGPIPAGYEVDHLCRTRGCVNPAHLEAVPMHVNNMRSESASALNARKTHCIRGHAFTPENTHVYTSPDGKRHQRRCRECWRIRNRQRTRAA